MDEETRTTQVSEEIIQMQEELGKLKDGIDSLRNRLTPVLKERSKTEGEEEKPISALVPLANTLRDCRQKIVLSGLEIAEITRLLEV